MWWLPVGLLALVLLVLAGLIAAAVRSKPWRL